MTQYFAFLRAVNVGGHTTNMETIRKLFTELGFLKVDTFIASGNVVFESSNNATLDLEDEIQSKLRTPLGYPVSVFLRTNHELSKISTFESFPKDDIATATALNVAFLQNYLDQQSIQKVMALKTDIDDFNVTNREIYWKCLKKQSDSSFSNALLEKKIGFASTIRGMNTIMKLVGKYIN